MTTKLTLSVDKRLVEKAKRYAHRQGKSLSEIVSGYLDFVSNENGTVEEIDPEVLEAADEIPVQKIPRLKDRKYEYLRDKYLHE
jgi:hypothetical protein